jgi:hypothetical protein
LPVIYKGYPMEGTAAPRCPECDSDDTDEVLDVVGVLTYQCYDCDHIWVVDTRDSKGDRS